jgi:preprotein translocase subunit SecB
MSIFLGPSYWKPLKMKVSPLQPESIVFDNVCVQVRFDQDNNCLTAPDFDFQGVNFNCDVGHGDIEVGDDVDQSQRMLVSIRVQVENQSGKLAPYKLDVKVSGIFKWLDTETEPILRKDLMVVNGAAILYGSVREMVLTITSRSIPGALTLPSFNFIDDKPSDAVESELGVDGKVSVTPPLGQRRRKV